MATAVVWVNWSIGKQHPDFARFAFKVQDWYGFAIGAMFSGVIGVGLYPLMGTRVWCRFGCPMAALLGLVHISSRYHVGKVLEEAREAFPDAHAIRDFDVVEIPFPERGDPVLIEQGARDRPEPSPTAT